MLLPSLCFLLLYVSVNCSVVSDTDSYHELYGKLGSFHDLFVMRPNNQTKTRRNEDEDLSANDLEIPDIFTFPHGDSAAHTFDIQDYNQINEQYKNFTQNYKTTLQNITRRSHSYEKDDKFKKEEIEGYKKNLMANLLIQFLMHSKYEVGKALTQREVIRHDKRYKLGYLFNRLRRLKTEQFKLVGVSTNRQNKHYKSVQALMRAYEKVVHYDVDSRYTCELIKRIYAVKESYDTMGKKKKKNP